MCQDVKKAQWWESRWSGSQITGLAHRAAETES